jgi:hypothetical protein
LPNVPGRFLHCANTVTSIARTGLIWSIREIAASPFSVTLARVFLQVEPQRAAGGGLEIVNQAAYGQAEKFSGTP